MLASVGSSSSNQASGGATWIESPRHPHGQFVEARRPEENSQSRAPETLREDQRLQRWIGIRPGGGLHTVKRQSKHYRRFWEKKDGSVCQIHGELQHHLFSSSLPSATELDVIGSALRSIPGILTPQAKLFMYWSNRWLIHRTLIYLPSVMV